MKITHIIASIEGGAGKACINLHKALLAENLDSKIVHLYGDAKGQSGIFKVKSANSFLRRILRKLGLSKRKEDLVTRQIKAIGGNYQTVSLPYSSYKLHLHPLVKQADIIHLHWVGDFVDLDSFFAGVPQPIIWTLHDMNPIEGIFHFESDQLANPKLATIDQNIRQQKKQLIESRKPHLVVSSLLSKKKSHERALNCPIHAISCVIATEKWLAIPKPEAKKALGLNEDCLTIGFGAQSLTLPFKGYKLFCSALGQLMEEQQMEIQLLTFGEYESTSLRPVGSKVRHLGKINDQQQLNAAYAAMDILVVPSAEESFGQVGFEALLCNTPIVATATGAMPEYVTFPSSTFEVNQVDQLKQQLLNTIALVSAEDVSLKNIRTNIINWYAEANPLKKHIELYQTLTA